MTPNTATASANARQVRRRRRRCRTTTAQRASPAALLGTRAEEHNLDLNIAANTRWRGRTRTQNRCQLQPLRRQPQPGYERAAKRSPTSSPLAAASPAPTTLTRAQAAKKPQRQPLRQRNLHLTDRWSVYSPGTRLTTNPGEPAPATTAASSRRHKRKPSSHPYLWRQPDLSIGSAPTPATTPSTTTRQEGQNHLALTPNRAAPTKSGSRRMKLDNGWASPSTRAAKTSPSKRGKHPDDTDYYRTDRVKNSWEIGIGGEESKTAGSSCQLQPLTRPGTAAAAHQHRPPTVKLATSYAPDNQIGGSLSWQCKAETRAWRPSSRRLHQQGTYHPDLMALPRQRQPSVRHQRQQHRFNSKYRTRHRLAGPTAHRAEPCATNFETPIPCRPVAELGQGAVRKGWVERRA